MYKTYFYNKGIRNFLFHVADHGNTITRIWKNLLLFPKRIDTALLCELATHPDFVKLLTDIQIYVEGIASMQIQNLNAQVDVARAEIMEKYQPDEHDKTAYLLQSAHVDEGDYFSSRVHKDMDGILADLRKAHIGRSDGAPKSTVAEELKRDLEEVANFEGSHTEQLLLVFCKQTKLRYNKLSEEEKQWLIRIMQKSELIKRAVSKRGKGKKQVIENSFRIDINKCHCYNKWQDNHFKQGIIP